MQRSWGLSRVLIGLSLLGCASGGWSQQQFWSDPFKTLENVTPAPGVVWQPRSPLPIVPPPESAPPPTTAAPLSLAQLTEFALRNNPRARQAWFSARAAAAAVGIEEADDLPDITANYAPRAHSTDLGHHWTALAVADTAWTECHADLHTLRSGAPLSGRSGRVPSARCELEPEPRPAGHHLPGRAGLLPSARHRLARPRERSDSSEQPHGTRCRAAPTGVRPCDRRRRVSKRDSGCPRGGQPDSQPGENWRRRGGSSRRLSGCRSTRPCG